MPNLLADHAGCINPVCPGAALCWPCLQVGYLRPSMPEHRVIESKPDSKVDDLRWAAVACHRCSKALQDGCSGRQGAVQAVLQRHAMCLAASCPLMCAFTHPHAPPSLAAQAGQPLAGACCLCELT